LEYIKWNLKLLTGKVYGIMGNIDAIENNVRQCDVNLNRIFKDRALLTTKEKESIEFRHMQRIRKYLLLSDVCLDIHSSPIFGSPVFAICEEEMFNVAKSLGVEYICSGFAEIEPGGTDYFMYMQSKVWICLECWFHGDANAFRRARYGLEALLAHYNMLEREIFYHYQYRNIWERKKLI